MHLKTAVILCAVYFITSVWGSGLNKDQIQICIRMYEAVNRRTYIWNIPQIMTDEFGIKTPGRIFKHHQSEHDYITFKNAFLALAYEDKISDSIGVPMLMNFEIEFYLNKFVEHLKRNGQNKYLVKEELSALFGELHLTENEKAKAESLAEEKRGIVHSATFLSIMLEILPEGNGLNEAQIQEFIGLYAHHYLNACSIDPLKIQNILNTFHMKIEPLEDSMLFKSDRNFDKVLMELMIVTAERSRTVNEIDTIVLSTEEVRSLLSEFIKRDRDQNGKLSSTETHKFMNQVNELPWLSIENPQVLPFNFEFNEINAAKYLLFHLHAKRV